MFGSLKIVKGYQIFLLLAYLMNMNIEWSCCWNILLL